MHYPTKHEPGQLNKHGVISETYLMDCIQGMKHYPNGYFDLAVVDPPYGNNLSGGRSAKNGWNQNINWDKCNKGWNLNTPNYEYFTELFTYLHAVPKHMRNLDKNGNKRDIKIVRTGRMLGNCHKEVKIIENGITI